MENRTLAHPSADTLRALGLGQLDAAAAEEVFQHLEVCHACHQQVAALSDDDFLRKLRQAHQSDSTPAPAKALPSLLSGPGTSGLVAADVPPELASHPQYEIVRELGRGGMGVVYLAQNKLMKRPEVLKVVRKVLLGRPGTLDRFLREIQMAARLKHDNVVAAYSAFPAGDLVVFAMEYVEGVDLAQCVKARGPLPVAHACFYAQQAALGLQHAYERGLVHRDIKPQNLILREKRKST